MSYEDSKKWRLGHSEGRNEQRKRYYRKFSLAPNQYERWSVEDVDFVLMSKLLDREIHLLIGRSVQAIQHKRCMLMKMV